MKLLIFFALLNFSETGNLIDLSSDTASAISSSGIVVEHNYVNDTVIAANRDTRRERDAFDMRKF